MGYVGVIAPWSVRTMSVGIDNTELDDEPP